ncbi:TetR/AcrR family transcriptional regulator [Streptomyces sp. 3N207]|uniref:TetR/AcrR family transcriptional regulator n=1 Tax=Streptomyces sp. 3N207 TaxID=3457417 RepID=UPI003FD28EC8
MAAQTSARRSRQRQATVAEIRTVARRLLIERGAAAVTINAVAREMGMSGPALYHYFSGHDELVGAITSDFFQELAEEMEAAREATSADPPARRLLAICRAMHGWARSHPAECRWIFASPVAPPNREPDSPRHRAGRHFEQIFLAEVTALWETQPFAVPDLDDLAPSLREQLRQYVASTATPLPPEAAHVFLSCWIKLHGLLCLEALHQLDFAYSDLTPVFEECLRDICHMLGLSYEKP